MFQLNQITVTEIDSVMTVHSCRGRFLEMKNRQQYGLSFCRSGKIIYRHRGKEYISDQSNAVILPQGASYTLYGSETGDFPLINFYCKDFFTDEFVVVPIRNNESYFREYERVRRYSLFPDSHLKQMGIFYGILQQLSEENFSEENVLEPAMAYLRQNYADISLSNEVLAEQSQISEVYFRKLFRERYGITPKQYILEIRMQKAKQLLSEHFQSVTEIAESCGFASVYHFCRSFKEATGITPTEYRKNADHFGL